MTTPEMTRCKDCCYLIEDENNMTTPEMTRCKDCCYLIEDENGNWICDDCGKEIHEIPLENGCPVED